jgi:hypothetical protein
MCAALLMAGIAAAACSRSAPAAPTGLAQPTPPAPSSSLAGVWVGSVTHPAGVGTLKMTAIRLPAPPLIGETAYEGTWEMNLPDAPARRGILSMVLLAERQIGGVLAAASPPFCALEPAFSLTLHTDGNRLTGWIIYGLCESAAEGEITLVKQ